MEAKGGAFACGAAPSPPPLPGLPFAFLLFLRIAVKGASIPADATIERFTQIKGPLLRAIRAELEGPEAAAVALKIAALYPPAATQARILTSPWLQRGSQTSRLSPEPPFPRSWWSKARPLRPHSCAARSLHSVAQRVARPAAGRRASATREFCGRLGALFDCRGDALVLRAEHYALGCEGAARQPG